VAKMGEGQVKINKNRIKALPFRFMGFADVGFTTRLL